MPCDLSLFFLVASFVAIVVTLANTKNSTAANGAAQNAAAGQPQAYANLNCIGAGLQAGVLPGHTHSARRQVLAPW